MKNWNWHRIAVGVGILMMVLAVLYCGLSLAGAVQDMRKFSGLGFSLPLGHYLTENDFWYSLWPLLWVTAEFVLYLTLKKRWLFVVLFGLHAGLWILAVILSLPVGFGYNPAGYYLRFAWMTLLPSAAYFISSFLCGKASQGGTADK